MNNNLNTPSGGIENWKRKEKSVPLRKDNSQSLEMIQYRRARFPLLPNLRFLMIKSSLSFPSFIDRIDGVSDENKVMYVWALLML